MACALGVDHEQQLHFYMHQQIVIRQEDVKHLHLQVDVVIVYLDRELISIIVYAYYVRQENIQLYNIQKAAQRSN